MTYRPRYIRTPDFTVVVTPHYQESVALRQDLLPSTTVDAMFDRMWAVGIEDVCCGFEWGRGFLYYRCKWNVRRERWELELITFTPNWSFHTRQLQFAEFVKP